MAWDSIKRILPQAIQRSGIQEQVTAIRVLEVAARVLGARWGEDRASLIVFATFVSGTLKAQTTSSMAMQMLNSERIEIMNSINHELGQRAVLKLDVRSTGF